MSRDWYKDHSASPDAYPDSEYLDWAQDKGLYVDAAGNVDYGPPGQVAVITDEDDGRCIGCGAEIGHYNGCLEDPEAVCLCHLCMGGQAVTSEANCPFHGDPGEGG